MRLRKSHPQADYGLTASGRYGVGLSLLDDVGKVILYSAASWFIISMGRCPLVASKESGKVLRISFMLHQRFALKSPPGEISTQGMPASLMALDALPQEKQTQRSMWFSSMCRLMMQARIVFALWLMSIVSVFIALPSFLCWLFFLSCWWCYAVEGVRKLLRFFLVVFDRLEMVLNVFRVALVEYQHVGVHLSGCRISSNVFLISSISPL